MKYYIKSRDSELIYSYLSGQKGLHTQKEDKLRQFIEWIWYISPSGCQWRLLPKIYGDWRVIHRRFKRWCKAGIWEGLMEYVKDPDMERVMIEAAIVRSHACSGGYKNNSQNEECLGRSKGGFTTKIHAVVDGLGNPLQFILTGGNRHEIIQAKPLLLPLLKPPLLQIRDMIAMRLWIFSIKKSAFLLFLQKEIVKNPEIMTTTFIKKDILLNECFFGKIKHFTRIFSRFDKAVILLWYFYIL